MRDLVISGVVVVISLLQCCQSKSVVTSLTARWSDTPLLLEAAEFMSRDGDQSFWHFVSATLDLKGAENMTHADTYQWILKSTENVLHPRSHEAMRLSLALRFSSPAIAMYQQTAQQYSSLTQSCEAFVLINGHVTCSPEEILDLRSKPLLSAVDVFEFDHLYPSSRSSNINAVLYGSLGSASFNTFHRKLSQLAEEGKLNYYLRYFLAKPSSTPIHLSGYGVELDIKNTEYKAVDSKETDEDEMKKMGDLENVGGFNFKKLKEVNPSLSEDLTKFQFHLKQESDDLRPLKVWELTDLSYQAAQKVAENEDPLEALNTLLEYSQNFPIHAHSLSKIIVSKSLKEDIQLKQRLLDNVAPQGESMLLLNGLPLEPDTLDPFQLFDMLYSETKLLVNLAKTGIPQKYFQNLLNLDVGVGSTEDYAVDIRHESVLYLNNLETDTERYGNWPKTLQYLLQPTFPGALRRIAKNIHHLTYIVNPADRESLPFIYNAWDFLTNSIPARFGLVFTKDAGNAAGEALCKALGYISEEEEPLLVLKFLRNLYKSLPKNSEVTVDDVTSSFAKQYKEVTFDEISKNSLYDQLCSGGTEFYKKSGLGKAPLVLYNGKPVSIMHPDFLDDTLVGEVYSGTSFWQRAVWTDEVNDGTNLLDFAMNQNHVMPRLNPRVLDKSAQYLDFEGFQPGQSPESLSGNQLTQYISDNINYIAKKDPEFDKAVTLWIVADLETVKGRSLAYQALKYLKKTESMRIGLISNSNGKQSIVSEAIQACLLSQSNHNSKLFITKILNEERIAELLEGKRSLDELEVSGMDSNAFKVALSDKEKLSSIFAVHQKFATHVLRLKEDEQLLVANGKMIGPFGENEEFTYDDFGLVDKYVYVLSSRSISSRLKSMVDLKVEGRELSDLTMKVTASLLKYAASKSRVTVRSNVFKESPSVVRLPPRLENEPHHRISVAFDPLSRAAQKLSPILLSLHQSLNVEVMFFLNCVDKWSEMPLKSFYRYVLPSSLEFGRSGELTIGSSQAVFSNLPQGSLFTLNVQPPESWLVENVRCPYDLDNIVLKNIPEDSLDVYYELANILVEGHCYEKQSGNPPRGLQFTLGTPNSPTQYDTIVMANLGYFQLKANPGSWVLRLREGLSREIYEISSTKYTSSSPTSEDVIAVVRSFTNRFIHVYVSKKPGMQDKDVLGDDSAKKDDSGIWDSVKSLWGSDGSAPKDECQGAGCKVDKEDEVLNIFSVASGHLYERFLRVMMLSVMKNTKAPVKFWFLKNYLSPLFKDSLDAMKQVYKFEYELVEYKWPRWLNAQTEKQRVIWGYKILFLDVLFPLSVKKIIFVDADQIVRADLTELRDMDLDGAPYGYTPFCDDKREMDGFRFWKSGYWASHLAGRKYHISALYVIDLAKFRKISAGDRLRGQYQGLSQDPNSLANLDQDLPNNMIHQVRIKSLPQDWLWCETWCSDASLKAAKTIDLCNNPLTKEPKLDRAMRIVPEWKEYDAEIRSILEGTIPTKPKPESRRDVHVDL